MDYASFWRRFGAMFIDGVFGGILGGLMAAIFRAPIPVSLVCALLYQPVFEASILQATPGKALLGMRVTDLLGQRITFKKALIRYLMKLVSGFILLIGYLMQPFTEKRQALHDIVAETLVVRGDIQNINYFQAWYTEVQEILGMIEKTPSQPPPGSGSAASPGPVSAASPSDLAGLYELFQKGILTEAEYNQKRAELLKKL
jgi:uncharacterized RDD family membrane protein YckC